MATPFRLPGLCGAGKAGKSEGAETSESATRSEVFEAGTRALPHSREPHGPARPGPPRERSRPEPAAAYARAFILDELGFLPLGPLPAPPGVSVTATTEDEQE